MVEHFHLEIGGMFDHLGGLAAKMMFYPFIKTSY